MKDLKEKIQILENKLDFYRRNYITGLYGRHDFMIKIEEFIENRKNFYLYFIDVNNLHFINKEKGYVVGDSILKEVSNILTSKYDGFIYHIGGDEFFIISDNNLNIKNSSLFSVGYIYVNDFNLDVSDIINLVDRELIDSKKKRGRRENDIRERIANG